MPQPSFFSEVSDAHPQNAASPSSSSRASSHATPAVDDLARVFNTALVATRIEASKDISATLAQLVDTPAFRAILSAVRQHARLQGIPERTAAEQVILAFRQMDQAWADYVFREGVGRLRNPST